MKPDLSIVIPTRNETMLDFTVRRLRETSQGALLDVIVVDDGGERVAEPPRGDETFSVRVIRMDQSYGNCFCRDLGIRRAACDRVLVLDAHMNMWDRDHWPQRIIEHIRDHPTDLACAVSSQLREQEMAMEQASGRYYGCKLDLFSRHSNGQYWIFSPRWDGEAAKQAVMRGEVAQIQCIMGGSYALSRQWYLDGLRAPWQFNRGWGASEQTVSIPNELLGGRNVILPVEIGHMYRTGQYSRVPYRTQWAHLGFNQMRLAHMLPIPDELRASLLSHVMRTPDVAAQVRDIRQLLNTCRYAEYRDFLTRRGVLTWDQYLQRWPMPTEWKESNT